MTGLLLCHSLICLAGRLTWDRLLVGSLCFTWLLLLFGRVLDAQLLPQSVPLPLEPVEALQGLALLRQLRRRHGHESEETPVEPVGGAGGGCPSAATAAAVTAVFGKVPRRWWRPVGFSPSAEIVSVRSVSETDDPSGRLEDIVNLH